MPLTSSVSSPHASVPRLSTAKVSSLAGKPMLRSTRSHGTYHLLFLYCTSRSIARSGRSIRVMAFADILNVQDTASPEARAQSRAAQAHDARCSARQGRASSQALTRGRKQTQGGAEEGRYHGAVVAFSGSFLVPVRCTIAVRGNISRYCISWFSLSLPLSRRSAEVSGRLFASTPQIDCTNASE